MSDHEDYEFEVKSDEPTYPMQASALRVKGFVLLEGHPCKIKSLNTTDPGKHGDAKVTMVGEDIFTGETFEDTFPTTANVDCPNVKRIEYTLIDVKDNGFLTIMDESGDTRDDLLLRVNCSKKLNLCLQETQSYWCVFSRPWTKKK
ncbi:hypothetical protein WMY93_005458 [Mugilogobius chulae]|uniref:Eukaryotic translation initiation factor 5A n=1 Tax=Mugilogobius chulae TaxID=88201 RepID=A0AAW0PGV0_9GOBI